MKFFFTALFMLFGCSLNAFTSSYINHADEITEEWLINTGAETGYTEHVRHFKRLFTKIEVRTFLEFGVGFSTKYFIDNCQKVVSVEFITPGSGPEWLQYCIDLYKDSDQWLPIAYFSGKGLSTKWARYKNKYVGLDSVYLAAAFQPVYKLSYTSFDSSFIDDLNKFINKQVKGNDVDVAFVDCGICIRGDLVQCLFNKVPIIVAHDINSLRRRSNLVDDVYGYGRIIVPENYEEVHMSDGMGTAFWIKKEDKYFDLIKDLQKYARELKMTQNITRFPSRDS